MRCIIKARFVRQLQFRISASENQDGRTVMNISTEAKLAKKNPMYYIHSAIGLLIVVAFFFMEPIKPITPIGMKVLGIFISMIYLWSFVEFFGPV